jgi:hypothetical protein
MNCKKIFRAMQVVLMLALFSSFAAAAQSGTSSKVYVYEFNVTGLLSQEQATKMDSALSGHGSIVKWETDYHHKKVKVTTAVYIQFKDLMTVCKVNKCEASEEHTLTEVEQQQ